MVDANAQVQAQAQVQVAQQAAVQQQQQQLQQQAIQQQVQAVHDAQQVAAQQAAQQVAQQQQQQQNNGVQTMVQSASPMSQVTVVSSGAQCMPGTTNMGPPQQQTVSVSMHQAQPQTNQVMQQQTGQVIAPAPAQSGSTTITTMAPLQQGALNAQQQQHPQQISADWGPGRVQVIQQPIQNPAYLQQLYNTPGQLLMPGNIALHPGISPQQIQVSSDLFLQTNLADLNFLV